MKEQDYAGFFQQFRPEGNGVEYVFAGVPKGDSYVSRLMKVYRATSDNSCCKDVYFIVRSPAPATDGDLNSIGKEFLSNLSMVARLVGNIELLEYLHRVSRVENVPLEQVRPENPEAIMVEEVIGDWLIANSNFDNLIPAMSEAFYTVACDFFLQYYLQWPYFEHLSGIDVFQPYCDLWLRGTECVFEGTALKLARRIENG